MLDSIAVDFLPGQWHFITVRTIDNLPQKLTCGAEFIPKSGYHSSGIRKELVEFINNEWYRLRRFIQGVVARLDQQIPRDKLIDYSLGY
jgi:hypothetical protein